MVDLWPLWLFVVSVAVKECPCRFQFGAVQLKYQKYSCQNWSYVNGEDRNARLIEGILNKVDFQFQMDQTISSFHMTVFDLRWRFCAESERDGFRILVGWHDVRRMCRIEIDAYCRSSFREKGTFEREPKSEQQIDHFFLSFSFLISLFPGTKVLLNFLVLGNVASQLIPPIPLVHISFHFPCS